MRPEDNLRGFGVWFVLDNRTIHGMVITHIRNGRWLIEARSLPKKFERGAGCRRIVLSREQFTVKAKRGAS